MNIKMTYSEAELEIVNFEARKIITLIDSESGPGESGTLNLDDSISG